MKMKYSFWLLAFFLFSIFTQINAQTVLHIKNGCHFDGDETPKDIYGYDPSSEAVQIISRITTAIGLEQNYTIKAANVSNALASTEGGQRYILYNTTFLENFKSDAQTKWAAYCVLAHEIGHHLNNHDFTETDVKKRKLLELAADRFAGNVLQKMGATLAEAQAGINTFSTEDTKTHPPKSARLEAVASGWKQSEEKEAEKETPQYATAKVSEKNEKAAKKWFDKGMEETKDRTKEIEYYTKAIELNPNLVVAFIYRGLANRHTDNYTDAIADYDEAIRLDPKNIVAYIGRGHVKRKWDEYEEAILDYDQAIKINPDEGVAYGAKGCCIYDICSKEWYDKNALSESSKKRLIDAIPLFDKALNAPFNPLLEGYYLDATAYKASALSLLKKLK